MATKNFLSKSFSETDQNPRVIALFGSLAAGVLWIAFLSVLIPAGSDSLAGDLLLDRNSRAFPYPFTIQNLMWLVFFIGVGELVVRRQSGSDENRQVTLGLLPEDDQTILRKQDIGPIYRKIQRSDSEGRYWLQRLLTGTMLQFQSSGSIDQVNAIFNSSLDMYHHETDLRYNLLRYLVWLIPTLGFIGTVIGIALALQGAGAAFSGSSAVDLTELGPKLMHGLTKDLGVAFYTTLLALLQSAVLMFALHLVQGQEEKALNKASQYCLKNFINRLYEQR